MKESVFVLEGIGYEGGLCLEELWLDGIGMSIRLALILVLALQMELFQGEENGAGRPVSIIRASQL